MGELCSVGREKCNPYGKAGQTEDEKGVSRDCDNGT